MPLQLRLHFLLQNHSSVLRIFSVLQHWAPWCYRNGPDSSRAAFSVDAGRGGIAWKRNRGHPKVEQNPSAALGFHLNTCLLQGSAKQHRVAWPNVTASRMGSPLPGDKGVPYATSPWAWPRSWLLLACLGCMVLQDGGQASHVFVDNPLLPGWPWTTRGKTQFGRTYHFWNGAAGRPVCCSAESSSRKCGCMWKQADLKQYSRQGITQIISQWQWSYLLSWHYEESIFFYLLMVVSGFVSLQPLLLLTASLDASLWYFCSNFL